MSKLKELDKKFRFDNMSVTYARGNIKDEKLKNVSKTRYKLINDFLELREKSKEKKENYSFLSIILGVIAITGIVASL